MSGATVPGTDTFVTDLRCRGGVSIRRHRAVPSLWWCRDRNVSEKLQTDLEAFNISLQDLLRCLEVAEEQRRAHREGSAMRKMCGKCAGCKVSAVDLLASAFKLHKSWFEVACQYYLVI